MREYEVTITETLEMTVAVEAESREEAQQITSDNWKKDNMVTELTDFNRNMMLSIDIVPVPTDEAVREVENRLLGVETNITNWQRRQNANNNFSAVVPYDMELQREPHRGKIPVHHVPHRADRQDRRGAATQVHH